MTEEEEYQAYKKKMLEQAFGKKYFNSKEFGFKTKEEYGLEEFNKEIDRNILQFKKEISNDSKK